MGRMKEIDEKNAKKSLSRTFGARIEKLLQLMNSFMNSVVICIQSNPEVSSLIVGGINCALSVSFSSEILSWSGLKYEG